MMRKSSPAMREEMRNLQNSPRCASALQFILLSTHSFIPFLRRICKAHKEKIKRCMPLDSFFCHTVALVLAVNERYCEDSRTDEKEFLK